VKSDAEAPELKGETHPIDTSANLLKAHTQRVLLNSYLCILVSFPRVSAPPPGAREGCKERKGVRSKRFYTLEYLITRASLHSIISSAQRMWPYVVEVWLFKTFIIS